MNPKIPDERNLNHSFKLFSDFLQRVIIQQSIHTNDPLFHKFLIYVLNNKKFHSELNLHFEFNEKHIAQYRINSDYFPSNDLEFDKILFGT